MPDKLDRYRRILGPHAERIEGQVEPLAEQRLHRDPGWYREERGKRGDPFAELERIAVEYASRRVAIAEAREDPAAKEMLAEYRRELGDRTAAAIATRAKDHGPVLRQSPERLEERARQLPRGLDRKVDDWVRDNGVAATELLALERAEQRTAELERAEQVEAAEPELGGGAVEWLSGPAINQRIEQRKQELVPELEAMSRRELTDETKRLEADLDERGRELYEQAAQLEEVGREEVLEDRHWRQGIKDVQGRWVELHARGAALQLVAERGLDRAREPEGIGF